MSDCHWYEIHGFASPREISSFEKYLANYIAKGLAEPVKPAPDRSGNVKCFRWKQTGEIWRLVGQDGTQKGYWEPALS